MYIKTALNTLYNEKIINKCLDLATECLKKTDIGLEHVDTVRKQTIDLSQAVSKAAKEMKLYFESKKHK